jgi:hypothetical protein
MNIHEHISNHASNLDRKFWNGLEEIIKNLPDIEDSNIIVGLIAKTASLCICSNYILGFDKEKRQDIFDSYVSCLKSVLEVIDDLT